MLTKMNDDDLNKLLDIMVKINRAVEAIAAGGNLEIALKCSDEVDKQINELRR